MAFSQDDVCVSHQLVVGDGFPDFLGVGEEKIRGSAYVEGPMVIGDPDIFSNVSATLIVGPNINVDSEPSFVGGNGICGNNYSPYSLAVSGDAVIFDNLSVNGRVDVGTHLVAQGEVISRCGKHILSAKKNFDIEHPSKPGWRLRYTCPEAPSNDVYIRGTLKNSNEILLPKYWKDFVDIESITVNITPIKTLQNIIVKDITEERILLFSDFSMPIHCFYHVFAERKDGEKLIPEYRGDSPADYPGNNNEYSISGYHYDVKNNHG
jgi:hypothetical protein